MRTTARLEQMLPDNHGAVLVPGRITAKEANLVVIVRRACPQPAFLISSITALWAVKSGHTNKGLRVRQPEVVMILMTHGIEPRAIEYI
jgi:hypothetical protein